MASDKELKWIYSKKDVENTPSRKNNIDIDKELSYRQQAANLIQDMGQRLSVNQLTINTAIVYMHRFYVYHSFTFSRYAIAPAALFLAAKVEEQPKKLEHVLKICYACLHPDKPHIDTHGDAYLKQAQELVQNELVLLQTLGFDISVDHPHTHVVKCTQLVKASRDLSQMAYFMATNSLHLTTFCLLYKPTVVAAMCIHLSCKWSSYEIPLSSDGKHYWSYMDSSITEQLLDTIVKEFLKILNRCPTRLRKLKNYRPTPKEGGESQSSESAKETSTPSSTQPVVSSLPASTAPQKEKKPTMSIEEYKRTHPKQAAHPKQESKNGSTKPQPTTNLPNSDGHKKQAKTESAEDLLSAINKDLEGRIRSEKLTHNHNSSSQERSAHHRSATHPNIQVANIKDRPQNHESQRRHHSDKSANHEHGKAQYKNLDSKTMVELYKKHPEKLKYLLKQKSQFVHLSDEEKHYYGRLHAKEQERLKRKQAEALQQQQLKAHKPVKPPQIEPNHQATPPQLPTSPPLTLKIKLPAKVSSANKQPTLSSSGSDPSPARPRKRGHGDLVGQGEHVSAKHSRRSEDHKRHHKHSSGNQSNGGSSKHKHHHHHHHSKSKSKSKSSTFDESTFQKSLSDAIKITQEHKKAPIIPTVTLKRTHNNEYFTPVQGDFDPNLPVPNQIPDEIFEDDNDSGAFTAANLPRLASYESAQSTPEAGEIKDNSPIHPNVSTLRTQGKLMNKGPGLFSPEAQLQRSISGFGYHSSSENEFSMPLIQKPSVQ